MMQHHHPDIYLKSQNQKQIYYSSNDQDNKDNLSSSTFHSVRQKQRQNQQKVFTSSSITSSITELSAINIRGLVDDNHIISKQVTSIVEQNTRKQHTLDSIGSEKSRSRSPLVDAPTSISLINSSDIRDYYRGISNNPSFDVSNNRFTSNQRLRESLDQISPKSISHVEDRTAPATTSIISSQSRELELTSEDNLSLDKILADIQADEFNKCSMNQSSSSSKLSDQKLVVVGDATELREFRKVDGVESSQSTSYFSSSNSSIISDGENQQLKTACNRSSSLSSSSDQLKRRKKKVGDKENEKASGFEIVWLNFTYSIVPNILEDPRWGKINSLFHKEPRTILKGLSGGLKSGQLVALMGPSGAGKTCLLECISGIRMAGIGGELKLRGRKKAQLVIVPQYDNFMPQFSVEEIIRYGSRMKNPRDTDHEAITDKVIEQLGLQACRTNNIGKCSGGQRKRVAIAQELVSRPNILILDEPTSGLDSSCCYQTLKVLRDVLDESVNTEQPMAIVTTIHQPSAKVFKMFDLVYLLGKTGYTAYSGPPDELLTTIRDVTGLECPQYSNPSDYMIELVSYDYGEEAVEKLIEFEKEKASLFLKQYNFRSRVEDKANGAINTKQAVDDKTIKKQESKVNQILSSCNGSKLKSSKSDTHLIIDGKLDETNGQMLPYQRLLRNRNLWSSKQHIEYKQNISVSLRKATSSNRSSHPFFWHIYVHLHRSFLQSIRDPVLNNMRILIHLGFATLLVLLYGKKSGEARGCPPILGLPTEITDPNNDNMIDLADNVGYLFMCIMMITYVSLMSTVLTFPIDIKTVGKEYKNGWYGTITYFLGKTIADLPFIIIYPVLYCLITWFVTNQAQDHYWRYFSFTGLIIMNAMNSQSFGLILGAAFVNSVTAATFLGPVITIPWYLFTGFTKRVHRLAEPFKTTSKFLFTRYVFEGLLDTVYGHHRCNCSEFLQKYYELRYEEAVRLGKLISAETLSSLDYYDGIDTIAPANYNKTLSDQSNQWFGKAMDAASTVFADGEDLNLAALMDTNVKASSLFSFGLDFEPTCPTNYRNYVTQEFRLDEETTQNAFMTTLGMLAVIRVLTFMIVTWKIRIGEL